MNAHDPWRPSRPSVPSPLPRESGPSRRGLLALALGAIAVLLAPPVAFALGGLIGRSVGGMALAVAPGPLLGVLAVLTATMTLSRMGRARGAGRTVAHWASLAGITGAVVSPLAAVAGRLLV